MKSWAGQGKYGFVCPNRRVSLYVYRVTPAGAARSWGNLWQ